MVSGVKLYNCAACLICALLPQLDMNTISEIDKIYFIANPRIDIKYNKKREYAIILK